MLVNSPTGLQAAIDALATFPDKPAGDWVARVHTSPVEVVAGAILSWRPTGGINGMTGDPMEPRRAAAQAILQARFSGVLSTAVGTLQTTIATYQKESGKQTDKMVNLTWVIAVLTGLMLVGLAVQIWLVLRGVTGS